MKECCYGCFLEVPCAEFQNNIEALAYNAIENDLVTGLDSESESCFPGLWTQVSFASKPLNTQPPELIF